MSSSEHHEAGLNSRRQQPRVKLAVEAVLLGMEGRQNVTLLDLSLTGAQLAFEEPPKERGGFITWMEFETFGDVVWREGLFVGVKFDRAIPEQWLETTHERVTDGDSYRHEVLLKQAKEWVGV